MLAEKVFHFIESHSLAQPEIPILVAYSGGPDSTCLLHLLHEKWKNCAAVYVNHNLRGEDSDREEHFVIDSCKQFGIPLFVEKIEWKRRPSNLEESARKRRYRHFAKVAAEQGFGAVAIAHNQNDVAETILQRLMRGSGPAGLAGIEAKRGLYIRPLLECSRAEILDFLAAHQIPYFIDTTNAFSDFQRNKIRNEVIPYLERYFNPSIIEALTRSSRWIREQNALVTELLEPYAKIIHSEQNRIAIDRSAFLPLSGRLRKALIRLAIHRADRTLHPESRTLKGLLEAIDKEKSFELPGYLHVTMTPEKIVFDCKKAPGITEVDVPTEGSFVYPPANRTLLFSTANEKKIIADRNIAFLDADKASFPLYIRNMRKGDAFQPLGMNGHKKLSDFFIDRKVSRSERKRIPLVMKDEEIVWVSGHQIHHEYRVTDQTKLILRIDIRDNV